MIRPRGHILLQSCASLCIMCVFIQIGCDTPASPEETPDLCNLEPSPGELAYFSYASGDTIVYDYNYTSLIGFDTDRISGTLTWVVTDVGDCEEGRTEIEIQQVLTGERTMTYYHTGEIVTSPYVRESTVQVIVTDSVEIPVLQSGKLPRFGPDSTVSLVLPDGQCFIKCTDPDFMVIFATLEVGIGIAEWRYFIHAGVQAEVGEKVSLQEP